MTKTDDKSNFSKHNNSKKHTKMVIKYAQQKEHLEETKNSSKIVHKCTYCGNNYATTGSLARHKNVCSIKEQSIIDNKIINFENEISKLNIIISKDATMINTLQDEIKHLKLLLKKKK